MSTLLSQIKHNRKQIILNSIKGKAGKKNEEEFRRSTGGLSDAGAYGGGI